MVFCKHADIRYPPPPPTSATLKSVSILCLKQPTMLRLPWTRVNHNSWMNELMYTLHFFQRGFFLAELLFRSWFSAAELSSRRAYYLQGNSRSRAIRPTVQERNFSATLSQLLFFQTMYHSRCGLTLLIQYIHVCNDCEIGIRCWF